MSKQQGWEFLGLTLQDCIRADTLGELFKIAREWTERASRSDYRVQDVVVQPLVETIMVLPPEEIQEPNPSDSHPAPAIADRKVTWIMTIYYLIPGE